MSRHVILGKGAVGISLAEHLLAAGHEVVLLSKSGGTGTINADAAQVSGVAIDATDAAGITSAATGAVALYNCANPPYTRWPQLWPPINAALLDAAASTGAVLVTASNFYGYGAGTQHMTETSELASTEAKGATRAAMWRAAERRHRAGELRATEVRGGDYFGPHAAGMSLAGSGVISSIAAGKKLRTLGTGSTPHSWAYLPDFAAALAAAATTPEAWGSAWHVPSPGPLTFRDLTARLATALGAPAPRYTATSPGVVAALGLVVPFLREASHVMYQHAEPFVADSAASEAVLHVAPTPWETAIPNTVAAWRADQAATARKA